MVTNNCLFTNFWHRIKFRIKVHINLMTKSELFNCNSLNPLLFIDKSISFLLSFLLWVLPSSAPTAELHPQMSIYNRYLWLHPSLLQLPSLSPFALSVSQTECKHSPRFSASGFHPDHRSNRSVFGSAVPHIADKCANKLQTRRSCFPH